MGHTVPTPIPGTTIRLVDVPGRGPTVVWDASGPPGAATLVLLHGATLTAALNWSGTIDQLRRHYRVLLLDQRGHGTDVYSRAIRLEDCADDVAGVAEQLGVEQLVPVGYSLGGLVAQLVWRRHHGLVAGLVLCSTARHLGVAPWLQPPALVMPGLLRAATWLPSVRALRADLIGAGLLDHDGDPADRAWALSEMRRTPMVTALSAIQAACAFSSHGWIRSVTVPTALVITGRDRVIPPSRQWSLARALPGSTVVEVDGGHDVFLGAPHRFAVAVSAACAAVASPAARAAPRSDRR